MALVLDATIGGEDSNTYITLADAETVMEGVFYKDNWSSATDDNKNIALVEATRMVNEQIDFYGTRTYPDTQALEFPRYNCPMRPGSDGYVNYFESDIIPTWLENATAIMADSILGSNRGADSDTRGFKMMKVDVLELEIDKYDRPDVLPDSVWDIIKFYGEAPGSSSLLVRN